MVFCFFCFFFSSGSHERATKSHFNLGLQNCWAGPKCLSYIFLSIMIPSKSSSYGIDPIENRDNNRGSGGAELLVAEIRRKTWSWDFWKLFRSRTAIGIINEEDGSIFNKLCLLNRTISICILILTIIIPPRVPAGIPCVICVVHIYLSPARCNRRPICLFSNGILLLLD